MRALDGKRLKDWVGGCFMMVVGAAAAIQGSSYSIGALAHMGPGFFPVMLGVLLVLIGAGIMATAKSAGPAAHHGAEWRGWGCIALGIVAFVVLGRYGGLVPATFAIVFISALGDRDNSPLDALVLAVGMVLVCVAVFWWALQVQFPLFSWD